MKQHYTAFFLLPFILFSAVSCGDGKFPGFSEAEPGIYYKLHVPGETGKKAADDDYYEIEMQNKFGGKVFYDSRYQTGTGTLFVQASTSKYFSVLGEGDSATFLLPGGDLKLPGTPDTGMIEMNVKVVKVIKAADYEKLNLASDNDVAEQLIIQRYCKNNRIAQLPDSTGLIFIETKKGNGKSPESGKNITIRYTGTLLAGTVFDDTESSHSPFTFTWGQEDQVIPGIQKALQRMKAGGKAKIILPSALAFGTGGSSSGIVPPHTPVMYELELVSAE